MSTLERLWYGEALPLERVVATALLGPVSLAWRGVTAARNALFDLGVFRTHRVEGLQVVSVGNLVAGGSGKTPLVIFLARWATAAGKRVAVLSRGYGRRSSAPLRVDPAALPDELESGDEPRLIARSARVPVYLDADRVRAARRARDEGFEVVLLDDGFQHRRLARDVDLLIHVPEASGAVLPLGPCREGQSARRRATVVWNGPASVDPRGGLVVSGLRGAPSLSGEAVVALTGIARPARFVTSLERLGARVELHVAFSDHHRFTTRELDRVRAEAGRRSARIVTTEKDAERLPSGFPAVVVETRLSVAGGLDTLARALGWPAACAPPGSVEEGAP
ncbi:MAG: tetraacyldisaccharide 4'-kinase [Myxococcaceae bacterium]|nr:tetraacyldisaccharide 4'-kinase [Myxococcaceae bacterium]